MSHVRLENAVVNEVKNDIQRKRGVRVKASSGVSEAFGIEQEETLRRILSESVDAA